MEPHKCKPNMTPTVDAMLDGEPVISATVASDGVEVYVSCEKCGQEATFEYEYVDGRLR